MNPIRITSLHVYPLKGGRGLDRQEIALDRFGPVDDRRWLIVDPDGSLVTQREVADLCLVSAVPGPDGLHLTKPGAGEFFVPRPAEDAPRRQVRVWADRFDAVDLGKTAAAWCSSALGRPVGLVSLPDDATRRTDRSYDPQGAPVGFADGYPLLVIGEASLDGLNRRLPDPLPMTRFRPNVVVAGSEPHDEDSWRHFEIDGVPFDGVKLCARCVVTTTDQHTGVRGAEPLRTLASYRRREKGLMFGMNVVHRGAGRVRVGAAVTVSDRWAEIPT